MEEGRLMKGPFRPFAFRVDLADLKTDALGEVLDLGDVVHVEPAAAAALKQAQQQQQQQQQQQSGGGGGGGKQQQRKKGGAAVSELLGSLSDFVEGDAGGGGSRDPQQEATDALTQLQLASGGRELDLAVLMPRLAAAAQRVHLHLLQLLRRCSYSPEELRRQLMSQMERAEAVWAEQIAGTPLAAALMAAGRELEAAAAASASASQQAGREQQQQQQGGGDEEAPEGEAAAEGQEGSSGSADEPAAAPALPRCLDFAWQRQQVEAVVAALVPLMDRAGAESEREAAQLGAQLRWALEQLEQQPAAAASSSSSPEQPAAESGAPSSSPETTTATASSTSSSSSDGGDQQQPADRLRSLVSSAPPPALAVAFNQMDLDARRRLLEAAPEARVALNVRGVDLRAATEGQQSYSPARAAVSAIGANAAGSTGAEQLPEWPGQVPALVDAYGYEDVPRRLVDAVVEALRPLEEAAGQLERLLAVASGAASSSSSAAAAPATASSADVLSLREAAATYSTLLWAYDKVLQEQAAELAGEGAAPQPPSHNAQRRMMRILRELDPNGGSAVGRIGVGDGVWIGGGSVSSCPCLLEETRWVEAA